MILNPYLRNNRKTYTPYNRWTSNNAQRPRTEATVTCQIPLKTYNFKVKLFPSRCRLRKTDRTTAKISKYHILESKNTGRDICHDILDTDIGLDTRLDKRINLDSVIPELSQILQSFKIRHNRFNYFNELKYIVENGQRTATQKYKNQINIHLLQSFFSLLLYKNVPFELFGTLRNQKAIKKTIYHLLKTVPKKMSITSAFKRTVRETQSVTGAQLDLRPLFNKLDISNIRWLHLIDNDKGRWIIILKLLHWFFTKYIIKILHKYVVLKVDRKKWVYMTKDTWCTMQEEFIKEKKNNLDLVPFTKLNKIRYYGTYKFIPGSSGLRTLFIAKYNADNKYNMDVVLRFLQQLYVTYFNKKGIPTLASCKKEISVFQQKIRSVQRRQDFVQSTNSNYQFYVVRCDIQDAFGSIIQKKLCDIIVECCEQLERFLAVRDYILTKRGQRKKPTVQILSHKLEKEILKNAIPSRKKPKLVQTKKLINKVKELIFHYKVKLNDGTYSIKFGVPQGVPVSPILSDIYYQHIFNEIFSEYTNNGLLCRYVDDIIYMTENEHYAAQFLETINDGIPQYNIRFNPNKIETNVGISPYRPMIIKFLRQIAITL